MTLSRASRAIRVSGGGVGAPARLADGGSIFQAAILGFPLVAGWIIVGLGYPALFAVLVFFALVQAIIGWWRYAAVR